jgi:hypothetical protein
MLHDIGYFAGAILLAPYNKPSFKISIVKLLLRLSKIEGNFIQHFLEPHHSSGC